MPGKVIPFGRLPEEYRRPGDEPRISRYEGIEVCGRCHHTYDKLRPRCPACGMPTPKPHVKKVRVRKERTPHPTACALCRRRKAKATCPRCGKLVHPGCKNVHVRLCEKEGS